MLVKVCCKENIGFTKSNNKKREDRKSKLKMQAELYGT